MNESNVFSVSKFLYQTDFNHNTKTYHLQKGSGLPLGETKFLASFTKIMRTPPFCDDLRFALCLEL